MSADSLALYAKSAEVSPILSIGSATTELLNSMLQENIN